MTGRLERQVAIVTGGGAGLGRGIARALASEAATVVVAGRTLTKCAAVVDEIATGGGQAVAMECDVTDRSQVVDVVSRATQMFGPPSIMVNNAHGGPMGTEPPLEELTEEHSYALWRGGFLATLFGMQAVFPAMKQRRSGSIVNLVSLTGITGEPQYAAYGSTKEAVRALTRHAAREWGRYGIRVNAISPAGFNEAMEPFRANLPEEMQKFVDRMPLGYLGDPLDDIGRAVVALFSDLRYVTGSTFSVDGGLCVLR